MPKKRNTGLPKISQLPSGAYHANVYSHTDADGKRRYESFTGYDYNQVMLQIVQFKADKKRQRIENDGDNSTMTVYDAIQKYIELSEPLSSPATIRSYLSIHKNCFQSIAGTRLCDLTQDMIVSSINVDKRRLSIKSLKNANSLLRSTLETYRPSFHYKVNLKKTEKNKDKNEITVPTEEEVHALMEASKGTKMEIPIILTACCGLRPSELSALTWNDFNFDEGTLSIVRAIVRNKENKYVEKGTKSEAGTRKIRLFPLVFDRLQKEMLSSKNTDEYICIKPSRISDNFRRIRQKAGVRYMRFYDLRHYLVSVMVSLNIPNMYIADYVGHEDEEMIRRVYGHIMAKKKTSIEEIMHDYFRDVFPKNS